MSLLSPPTGLVTTPPWRTSKGSLFLVVSDIHATADKAFEFRADKIIQDVTTLWRRLEPLFGDDERVGLLVLGDVTRSSGREQFDLAEKALLTPLSKLFRLNVRYAVAGNHDHVRDIHMVKPTVPGGPVSPTPLHPSSLASYIERLNLLSHPDRWELSVGTRFFLFHEWDLRFNFRRRRRRPRWTAAAWAEERSTVSGRILLVGLNSAISSNGQGDDDTRLWIGAAQIPKKLLKRGGSARRIVLLHHSPHDLDEFDGDAKNAIMTSADLVVHGHHHVMGSEEAPGVASIVLAPSLGNPEAGGSSELNKRDGLALLRCEPTKTQVFYLTHRPPSSGEAMKFEGKVGAGGVLTPDEEIGHGSDSSTGGH
jgi:predicted phosphodiesterase